MGRRKARPVLPHVAVSVRRMQPALAQAAAWKRLWNQLLAATNQEAVESSNQGSDGSTAKEQEK
jgi:hypothetical protein